MEVISINLPLIYQNGLQKLVDMGLFHSMSQVMRTCIDRFLKKEVEFKNHMEQYPDKRKHELMTANIPISDKKLIADEFVSNFVGSKPQYPSRSELVRVAIRDFLKDIYEGELTIPVPEPEPEPIPEEEPNIFVDKNGKHWNIDMERYEYV